MKVTTINASNVVHTPFEQSHLLAKLDHLLLVAHVFEDVADTRSFVHSVVPFDLGSQPAIYEQVKADYEFVRDALGSGRVLSGHMGKLIQPRTSGPGHGVDQRSFYARPDFVGLMLGGGTPTAGTRFRGRPTDQRRDASQLRDLRTA